MDIIAAIHSRNSAGRMTDRPVAPQVIEALLSAAVQAPNHYETRPWRFVVMTGDGRKRLGEAMAESFQQRFPQAEDSALAKERLKPLRAPVLIAVAVDAPSDPRVLQIENVCAAAAACENILLAAEGMGLGVHWRTGDAARDPRIKSFLGLTADQELIAFLYVGYPEQRLGPRARPGFEDRTVWMN